MHEIADSVQPEDPERHAMSRTIEIFNSISPPERSQLREAVGQLQHEWRSEMPGNPLPARWERARIGRDESRATPRNVFWQPCDDYGRDPAKTGEGPTCRRAENRA